MISVMVHAKTSIDVQVDLLRLKGESTNDFERILHAQFENFFLSEPR